MKSALSRILSFAVRKFLNINILVYCTAFGPHRWTWRSCAGVWPCLWLAVFILADFEPVSADVKSTTGSILMDVNSDGVQEAVLNTTGFGIGTIAPSANLHVAGNSIVTGAMVIGGNTNTSGSNIHLSGSMGMTSVTLAGNTALGENSLVFADTSAGNVWLYLPAPSSVIGRTYMIKKVSNSNKLYINGSSALIDGAGQWTMNNSSSETRPYLNLISSGNAWYILDSLSGGNLHWTPANLNAEAWYDAAEVSTIVSSSGNVSQWTDKSGKGLHLSASGTAMPRTGSEVIHGHNVLVFNGSTSRMTTASNPFHPTITNAAVFMVVNIKSINSSTLFSISGNTTNRWQSHFPNNGGTLYFDCGNIGTTPSGRISIASGFTANQVVLAGFYGSLTENKQQVWVDGVIKVEDASGHTVSTDTNMSLGWQSNYDEFSIGEWIIINGTVTNETREKIEGYLAHKWGLTSNLPGGHPYKSLPPSL